MLELEAAPAVEQPERAARGRHGGHGAVEELDVELGAAGCPIRPGRRSRPPACGSGSSSARADRDRWFLPAWWFRVLGARVRIASSAAALRSAIASGIPAQRMRHTDNGTAIAGTSLTIFPRPRPRPFVPRRIRPRFARPIVTVSLCQASDVRTRVSVQRAARQNRASRPRSTIEGIRHRDARRPGRPGCSAATSPSAWSRRGDRVRALVRPEPTPRSSNRSASSCPRRPDRPRRLPPGRPRASRSSTTRRRRWATGAAGASSRPAASTRPGTWPRRRPRPGSGGSSTSARPAPTAIRPRAARRSTSRPRSARTSGRSGTTTPGARSSASGSSGGWPRTSGLPLTVIRPSWLYGERDRTTTARLVGRLASRRVPLIGPGDNPLERHLRGNVADAAILAADDPGSAGEAYNITHQGPITQARVPRPLRRGLRAPPIRRRRRYRMAFAAALRPRGRRPADPAGRGRP